MTTALLALLLAASPTTPPPLQVAAPGLDYVDVDPRKAEFLNNYFADQLAKKAEGRLKVITASQVAAILGLERQKQLLGCSDEDSSCLAELAGALGADAVVVGNVARFGPKYAFTLKLVSSRDASVMAAASSTGVEEGAALDWLAAAAAELADTLFPDLEIDKKAEELKIREADRNALRVTLLGIEYARRLAGTSWVGARVAAFPAVNLSGGGLAVSHVELIARYERLHPDSNWHWSALAGLGAVTALNGGSPGVGFTLGVDGGYQSLRLGLEVSYIPGDLLREIMIAPNLGLAFTF